MVVQTTGTNDRGILFAGNKKLDPIVGKEETHSTQSEQLQVRISVKKGINIVKQQKVTSHHPST